MIDPSTIEGARSAAAYLRDQADFNRSWTDGRRGGGRFDSALYIERRLEVAEERDRWATAIEGLIIAATGEGPT